MIQTPEQIARKSRETMARVLRKNNTPAKARAFLLRAGILEKHCGSPNGVRLAKRFR